MTNQHPITPPPELIKQWVSAFYDTPVVPGEFSIDIATKAAQWGADQELEKCCEWMEASSWVDDDLPDELRMVRRPKPLSLKEQALLVLHDVPNMDCAHHNIILRALEALPNDQF